ncbi:MAG: OPT/YSL family transporter, partial [Myxococcota bacterium]
MQERSNQGVSVEYAPLDLSVPQFTVRAVLTGMILGSLLSLCNIYIGLKIGWGFNVSVTAALLGFGIYGTASHWFGVRTWNIYENNINQTTASAAASIPSAGFIAPIPALTMLTDQTFSWGTLAMWTCSVALVGVVV